MRTGAENISSILSALEAKVKNARVKLIFYPNKILILLITLFFFFVFNLNFSKTLKAIFTSSHTIHFTF